MIPFSWKEDGEGKEIPPPSKLDPDLNLEKAEEQEEQGDCQDPFQGPFAEEFLDSTAEHTAYETPNDDADRQPEIGKIAINQVSYERPDTAETGPDKGDRDSNIHGKCPQGRHAGNQ